MKRVQKAIIRAILGHPTLRGFVREGYDDPKEGRYYEPCKESVWAGDPYGWAAGALVTISHEQGLPSICYDWEYGADNWWNEVCAKASEALGFPIFIEAVNGAVSAIYRL